MSQDPFWRNVKAVALVHTRDTQGQATPNEGVTGGARRFKVRRQSQWTAGVQIWQRIHATLNYWLFFFFPPALKAFVGLKNISFFYINGTIRQKRLQSQIIHCNPPFEDLNGSNWAFMTYKLYLPLFFIYLFIFPSPLAFVFLPSRHAAE